LSDGESEKVRGGGYEKKVACLSQAPRRISITHFNFSFNNEVDNSLNPKIITILALRYLSPHSFPFRFLKTQKSGAKISL
jgi:hypothetical protein